jgi:DNA-binding beta-propeller fold protein YncE
MRLYWLLQECDFCCVVLKAERERTLMTRRVQVLERDKVGALLETPLSFPAKLAVDEARDRLFIADSNNNRILVTTISGQHLQEVGGAGAGLLDGRFFQAAFHRPQGLAYSAKHDTLFVADTENHAVRGVDFSRGQVTTLAGNGAQGADYIGGRKGLAQQLNSPWDVVLSAEEDVLFIAMAGAHQIWRLDIESGECGVISGTGAERNQNGSMGSNTAWAQPSGLALRRDGGALYASYLSANFLLITPYK